MPGEEFGTSSFAVLDACSYANHPKYEAPFKSTPLRPWEENGEFRSRRAHQSYSGYIQLGTEGYIIQPLPWRDLSGSVPHSLERLWIKDLDVKNDTQIRQDDATRGKVRTRRSPATPFDDLVMQGQSDGSDSSSQGDELGWDGYYIGDVWKPARARNRQRAYQRQSAQSFIRYAGSPPPHEDDLSTGLTNQQPRTFGQVVCDGPYCEYHKVKADTLKWLEMAIAVDGRFGHCNSIVFC